MKTTYSHNRINVSFSISAKGSSNVNIANKINGIAKKFNAQTNIMENKAPYVFHENGDTTPVVGSFGGAITFHASEQNYQDGAKELIAYLESVGLHNEEFKEVTKTHRDNGEPYKRPQTFIEAI